MTDKDHEIIIYVDDETLVRMSKLAKDEGFISVDECAEYLMYKMMTTLYGNGSKDIVDILRKTMADKNLSCTDLIIYSRYQTGMSIEDIATELKISEEKVKEGIEFARTKFPAETHRPGE